MSDSNTSQDSKSSQGGWQTEAFALVRRLFEDRIPFNQQLGLVLHSIGEGEAVLRFPFKDELVGNIATETLIDCLQNLGPTPDYNQQALKKAIQTMKALFN